MTIELKKIDKYRWEVPKTGEMRVPGIIYATEQMLKGEKRHKLWRSSGHNRPC
jgi:tRNA-splicing ligase RtcB